MRSTVLPVGKVWRAADWKSATRQTGGRRYRRAGILMRLPFRLCHALLPLGGAAAKLDHHRERKKPPFTTCCQADEAFHYLRWLVEICMRTRLLILVLLVIVPASFLLLRGNLKRRQSEKLLSQERAIAAARSAAAHQSYYVRQARQELATMAQFPFAVMQDRALTEKGLKSLRRLLPDFDDFGLIETNGTIFCHCLGSNITQTVNPILFQKVATTREFASAIFQRDPAGMPTFQFGYPVIGTSGELSRVMYASLKTHLLSDTLTNISLPEGGVVMVFNADGDLLARQPDPEKWVGKQLLSDPSVRKSLNQAEGVFETADLDGIDRLYAVSTIRDLNKPVMFATVGIPRREVFARANQEFIENSVVLFFILALLLCAAWWYSDRVFLRPVTALVNTADRIGAGDLAARTGVSRGSSELHRVAERFDQMAASMEKRQRELEQANLSIRNHNSELERSVANRTSELRTVNNELEAFNYTVSHDLRAPVRHMSGFAQMLLKDPKFKEDVQTRRRLEVITSAAKHMGELIDALLAFSRMGRQSLSVGKVNFTDIVKEIVARTAAEEPQRIIEWRIDPLPEVCGDAALLRQVWVNLIANAVKYTRDRSPAIIEIKTEEADGETVFSIKDNGAGFDMAYADKLFGVFQRLHHSDEFEGTGIGLATVRRIISKHGGRAWAEGAVGKGAVISFSLPKA
jgi:signal transduction histidine kinase